MQLFSWRFISAPLKRIDDVGYSPVDLEQLEIFQAAVRKRDQIFINEDILANMPPAHAAGLILHEVIYATLPPRINKDTLDATQINSEARRIVGGVYSSEFDIKKGGIKGIISRAINYQYYPPYEYHHNESSNVVEYEGRKTIVYISDGGPLYFRIDKLMSPEAQNRYCQNAKRHYSWRPLVFRLSTSATRKVGNEYIQFKVPNGFAESYPFHEGFTIVGEDRCKGFLNILGPLNSPVSQYLY